MGKLKERAEKLLGEDIAGAETSSVSQQYASQTIIPGLYPWIAGGAVAAAAALSNSVPEWGVAGLAACAAYAAYRYARKRLETEGDETAWPRRRRHAGIVATAGAAWLATASFIDWTNPARPGAGMLLGLLAATGVAAVPYWTHRRSLVPIIGRKAIETRPGDEQFRAEEIVRVWTERLAVKGRLKDCRIEDVRILRYGWSGLIILGDETDPETVEAAGAHIARAYRIGLAAVTITLDPENASQAHVMVLTRNPLWNVLRWRGGGINEDGTAIIGKYLGGDDMTYRFYDDGGCWHDLISGATGSGKSEVVNLLLCMELRHGMIASYLIDPQHGQTYGELTDCLGGFASKIQDIRILLSRIEAEMYRRNEAYKDVVWTQTLSDGRTRQRKGIKTWRPTAEMPMLSVTIDEAHSVLKDDVCKEIVARLVAMGRKCGIRVRLITQVPLLTSLGGKMEIRDAVASGNVIVLRTANRLSGEVAANGNLPGKPHKLPRRWPNRQSAAGVCYSVGEGSIPQMARVAYADDTFDWLRDDDGAVIHRSAHVELPEPYLPEQAAPGAAHVQEIDDKGTTCAERSLTYFQSRPGVDIPRAEFLDAVTGSTRSKTYALASLTDGELSPVERVADGVYRLRNLGD